ncbi:hypothetical protein ACRALDRAFT_211032 [Sodiomyces alcalophilus JCM 7366]|uniref:uncharacterized protein n=1 Tax=Sodiomyces alcalophilus JCM 7366 TaxID=591952 RepID=UPI0039B4B04C
MRFDSHISSGRTSNQFDRPLIETPFKALASLSLSLLRRSPLERAGPTNIRMMEKYEVIPWSTNNAQDIASCPRVMAMSHGDRNAGRTIVQQSSHRAFPEYDVMNTPKKQQKYLPRPLRTPDVTDFHANLTEAGPSFYACTPASISFYTSSSGPRSANLGRRSLLSHITRSPERLEKFTRIKLPCGAYNVHIRCLAIPIMRIRYSQRNPGAQRRTNNPICAKTNASVRPMSGIPLNNSKTPSCLVSGRLRRTVVVSPSPHCDTVLSQRGQPLIPTAEHESGCYHCR